MGDPKLSMFSSYLSVLANKIYDLITGVGFEPGQMIMYVYICKMSEFLGVQLACRKRLVMPNTVKPCLQK